MKTIRLEAIDKSVSLAAYIAGVQDAIKNPMAQYKHGLTCWWTCSGKDIRRQFVAGVHDRINKHLEVRNTSEGRIIKKRMAHLKVTGRSCKWCGAKFTPGNINDQFCGADCQKCYYL